MEKFITATGKTIDLAIEAALKELQKDRDSVSVEVLENPKSGFFGIGAVPAKVKVTYEAPDEEVKPAPALSAASRSKPKKYEPKTEPLKPLNPLPPKEPKAPRAAEAPKPAAPEEPRQERRSEQPRRPRPEKRPAPRAEERENAPKREVREYAPAAPGSQEERIETFIKGLLEHMGSDAVPHAWKDGDDTYQVALVGEDLGMLIGRRGETLDAIQHLTNYAVNRDSSKRARINVDAENYRWKREESLRHLARKVAGKVVKYRRNITLEPMNAYERHVIHAALQEVPDVTTYSTGTEPNRRVVVAYSRYPQQKEKE